MASFWGLRLATLLGGYSLWSSNCGLKALLSFRGSLLFWGLRLATLLGATFRGSLFARPFASKLARSGLRPPLHIARPAGASRPVRRRSGASP
ncbi:hypothetical protein SGRA_3351 [Saprospira grandis str. Lewin]|uniref:Uncharacterized protein n=1 Tax=Saprospira grandis (strain Lewin) TaxID=984262 RepID=H6L142_SAPGL|nr:hypothetical protein SGRA_3351 [Saprospira grandis str. Lewin]